jgi:hypothetical protein
MVLYLIVNKNIFHTTVGENTQQRQAPGAIHIAPFQGYL